MADNPLFYRIREVDGFDDQTADILKALHYETFMDSAPQIEPEKDGYWWLVYAEKEPIGFAGMTYSVTPNHGYMTRSGVLHAHRGNHLQLRLIRAREAKARRLGWTALHTDTTDNVPSANTLIRAGFKLFVPAQPWAFAHSLYWKKVL